MSHSSSHSCDKCEQWPRACGPVPCASEWCQQPATQGALCYYHAKIAAGFMRPIARRIVTLDGRIKTEDVE